MNKLILFLPIFLLSCGTIASKEGFRVTIYQANGEVATQYEVKDYDTDDNEIYIMVGGEKKRVAGSYKIERFVK